MILVQFFEGLIFCKQGIIFIFREQGIIFIFREQGIQGSIFAILTFYYTDESRIKFSLSIFHPQKFMKFKSPQIFV